jgi:recombination endonuclease VII
MKRGPYRRKELCSRGHVKTLNNAGTRLVCKVCREMSSKLWKENNPEKVEAYQRKSNDAKLGNRHTDLVYMQAYYEEHKEKQLGSQKERYKNDPEFRQRMLIRTRIAALKRIGWTPESVEKSKVEQENRCAICSEVFTSTPHADHDHQAGKARGLLCGSHNRMLGLAQDDPKILEAAAAYLRKWGK